MVYVERMRRMSALLRKDAANPKGVKFDLGSWAEPADFDVGAAWRWQNAGNAPVAFTPAVSCNTQACAFGLAAISGEFAVEGLGYEVKGMAGGPMRLLPTYQGETDFNAAEAFFGITHDEALYFFDPECYETVPREAEGELLVAQRIDDFLEGTIDPDFMPVDGEVPFFRHVDDDE
jgi:hypothetical protein